MQILGLLGMYFDAGVVFITKFSLVFRYITSPGVNNKQNIQGYSIIPNLNSRKFRNSKSKLLLSYKKHMWIFSCAVFLSQNDHKLLVFKCGCTFPCIQMWQRKGCNKVQKDCRKKCACMHWSCLFKNHEATLLFKWLQFLLALLNKNVQIDFQAC